MNREYRNTPEAKEKAKATRKIYMAREDVKQRNRELDRKRYLASDKRKMQKRKSNEKLRATPEGKIRRSILESKQYARKNGHVAVNPETVIAPHTDNNCDLCGKPPGKRRLCLDHCHKTGRFRGWLCDNCNGSLGHLGDTVEGLEKAIDYLKNGRPVGGAAGMLRLGSR